MLAMKVIAVGLPDSLTSPAMIRTASRLSLIVTTLPAVFGSTSSSAVSSLHSGFRSSQLVVASAVSTGVPVAPGLAAAFAVGVAVAVAVGVSVGVAVGVAVSVAVGSGVAVGVGVTVAVGSGGFV